MADATTQSSAMNWFDAINAAALTWYGVYQQGQAAQGTGVTVGPTRTGGFAVSATNPWPAVIIIGVIVIGAVYVYKKA